MVIITIRMDFLSMCVDLSDLGALISGGMDLVGAMNNQELEDAITKPARMAYVEIFYSLAQQLIQDVRKQAGGPPLLEHVQTKRWRQKRETRLPMPTITSASKASKAHWPPMRMKSWRKSAEPRAQQQRVLVLLTRLVHISDVSTPETDTRLRYAIDDAEYQLVKPFIDAKLLITSAATRSKPDPTSLPKPASWRSLTKP